MTQSLPQIALIREEECIGCTKCIQVCPTDAIIGASKFMHTVISDACTGCGLCTEPCPVDCISLLPQPQLTSTEQQENEKRWDERRKKHDTRLSREKTAQILPPLKTLQERQLDIHAALTRAKNKKIAPSV